MIPSAFKPQPSALSLFDTHAHLCDSRFDADRDAVLQRAAVSGVVRIMEIGDAPHDWDKVLALAAARPATVHASLGFHPHYAQDWSEAAASRLAVLRDRFAAVGEIGLDYVVSKAPREIQIPVFRRMLALAAEWGKPVVVHCREAFGDLFPALAEAAPALARGGVPGVIHCFSGGVAEAERAAALGFYLGVDGPLTYPKNEALRKAVVAAGLERVVLETDSPYLPPQSSRGQRNEPARLPEVAARLAGLFGVPAQEAARRTTENGLRLFRLS